MFYKKIILVFYILKKFHFIIITNNTILFIFIILKLYLTKITDSHARYKNKKFKRNGFLIIKSIKTSLDLGGLKYLKKIY